MAKFLYFRKAKFHYFKQVINLSATCFHVELEQFLACFRVARVRQRHLGFLVLLCFALFVFLGVVFSFCICCLLICLLSYIFQRVPA